MGNLDGFIAERNARGEDTTPELKDFNFELKRKEAWESRPLLCKLGLHYKREYLTNSVEALLNGYTYCVKCYKGYIK